VCVSCQVERFMVALANRTRGSSDVTGFGKASRSNAHWHPSDLPPSSAGTETPLRDIAVSGRVQFYMFEHDNMFAERPCPLCNALRSSQKTLSWNKSGK
jgi:hypothetical protein